MTRPVEDPRAPGRRRAWASNALLWTSTTRRLLPTTPVLGETLLAFVGLHLCVQLCVWLVDGTTRGDVYADQEARADCPIEPRELRKVRDKLVRVRNDVLHFLESGDGDVRITARYSRAAPVLTLGVERSQGGVPVDSITREAVIALLDALEPWLSRQSERLMSE